MSYTPRVFSCEILAVSFSLDHSSYLMYLCFTNINITGHFLCVRHRTQNFQGDPHGDGLVPAFKEAFVSRGKKRRMHSPMNCVVQDQRC